MGYSFVDPVSFTRRVLIYRMDEEQGTVKREAGAQGLPGDE
jgi:hypothetical protein